MVSLASIRSQWNAQADAYNQWDALGEEEKVEFTIKCVCNDWEKTMNEYMVKRLALILAVQAEIEGMKAVNLQRQACGESIGYAEHDFYGKAEELRRLASKHDEQL